MKTDTKLVSAITALALFTALAASQPMPDVDGGDQIEQIESSAQQVEDTAQTRENNETAAQDVNQDRQQSQNQNKGIISGILSFLGL
jgi:ABC-type transport system involved in cytochrome bd biosynthesis fused ATPase/permease subunit